MNDLKKILTLYDDSRFLDAYSSSSWIFEDPEKNMEFFSIEELVHYGRLAGRLGNGEIQYKFYKKATDLDALHPLVKYYARRYREDLNLIDDLSQFENEQDVVFSDLEYQTSWYASNAVLYSFVRDFDKATLLIDKARSFKCNHAWIASCAAEVLFRQDKWDEALAEAEEAFECAPHMPASSSILARILAKKHRIEDINARLKPHIETSQSHEFLLTAIWYICVQAERSDNTSRLDLSRTAYDLSFKLETLAPIADSTTLTKFQTSRMDIAMLMDDYEVMKNHGKHTDIPFYKHVIERINTCGKGERRILNYRPVFQKHLTCLPASAATVLGAFGVHVDEDSLADELTYNGTSMWRIEEWFTSKGFLAESFILEPELIKTLIENGLPLVNTTEYTSSAHATAIVGFDERTGTFIVHDPSAERLVYVLDDRFHENEKPFGPIGLAIVTPENKHLLDLIPADNLEPVKTYHKYIKYMELNQPEFANKIVNDFMAERPDHIYSRRFEALNKTDKGLVYQAIEIQKNILKAYPNCLPVQRELLNNLHNTRNKSYIRSMLRHIVIKGKIPGISKFKEWEYPPTTYICQYADFTGDNAEGFLEAQSYLKKALSADPWSAEAYHVLGDIYIRQGKFKEAVIPFRVAALMDEYQEHYAREACNACRQVGIENEGLEFLKKRMERLLNKIHGSQAAITTIEALGDYGYPDQAIQTMLQCQATRCDDPLLSSYAVKFWIQMGKWDHAEEALKTVEKTGHRILYLSASVDYYQKSGQWQKALDLSHIWLNERPHNVEARKHYLELYKRKNGQKEALLLAKRWMEEFRNDEAFEGIHYDELKAMYKTDELETFIRKRIHRNQYDIWAWHELGFLILNRANLKSGKNRDKDLEDMDAILERIRIIAPDHPVSHALTGDSLCSRKDFKTAAEYYMHALEDDPAYNYCYSRIWDISASFSIEEQQAVLTKLEHIIFKTVGFLHHARSLVFNIAERYGAMKANEIILRWTEKKPDDPEIIEARVDLLLNYGQGRSDAQKAVNILEPALERFPNHYDLRLSLAIAYRTMLDEDKENLVLREIIRRNPLDSDSRNRLATNWSLSGKEDEAINLLIEGVNFDPLDESAWLNLSNSLWNMGRQKDALDNLNNGLRILPERINLRRNLSERLLEAGEEHQAILVLRQGLDIYPDGAFLWFLYGNALWKSQIHNDIIDIEHAFRKALELNNSMFDAADSLAILLTEQNRFKEAQDLIHNLISVLDDPMTARGRMVWIKRMEGKNKEALNDMVEIVKKWPTYSWAWSQVISWLEEDEEFTLAKDILDRVHPVMADNPRFMADRLMILKQAGVPIEQLSSQWDKLLNDFPRYERLHTLWIDQLIDDGAFKQADLILSGIERFYPESPYTLSRRVCLHVENNMFDQAIACACQIWLKPGNDDMWPDIRAWETIKDAGYMKQVLETLLPLAESGKRIRSRAFLYLIENLDQLDDGYGLLYRWIPFKWLFSSPTVARLRHLLDISAASDWDKGDYQGMILDRLLEIGYRREVINYVRRNLKTCMESTPIWQNLGRMHMTGKRRDFLFVRKIMAGWREHQGSEMWAVTNYVICLRRLPGMFPVSEDLDELYNTTKDLITLVTHDHTIKFIVCVCCETALRKNEDDTFLSLADQFDHIINGKNENFWMVKNYVWAPDILMMFKRLIMEPEDKNIIVLTRELLSFIGKTPIFNTGNWIRKEWLKRAIPRLKWAERIRIRILFL
ncbi:MAG: tetratricopeptide repeat protein [Desulfobacteraceae bacterium]|jgi:tetratricopeptide (TPR) repeat protein